MSLSDDVMSVHVSHRHRYFMPSFTCWEPVTWHQRCHVEAYSGGCGLLWVVVAIGGGGDEPAWGGCALLMSQIPTCGICQCPF